VDTNNQSFNVTGLTTAAFQTAAVATDLGAFFFGGGAGLYPFLTIFFPNGVQAVSGIVYSGAGGVPASGFPVSVVGNGAAFDTVTAGANGYYYAFGPAGTVAAGKSWLAYNVIDTAATLATATGAASQTDLDLFGKTVSALTAATTLSTAPNLLQTQNAAVAADGGLTAVTNFIYADTSLGLISTGASFTVDQSVSTPGLVIVTQAGDPITVADPITLTGGGALGLDAGGALVIDALISTGAGRVELEYGAAGLNFDLNPSGFGGSLTFASGGGEGITGQALTLNGTYYKLLFSMTDVAALNGASGHFALAQPIGASGTYANSVVAGFSGTLEGLGNSISALSINGGGNSKVGLIGTLNPTGLVRDVGIAGGSVSGLDQVGGLVGFNRGTITGSVASDTVQSSASGFATGGLVGENGAGAKLSYSYAKGTVTGGSEYTGGLVGYNYGAITGGFSTTGAVSAASNGYLGGLVGYNASGGTITDASASRTVTGASHIGGLVGYNDGSISDVTATGAVSAPNGHYVGGLVGQNDTAGTITGAAVSGATVSANGAAEVGGLVGVNGGAITNASASDPVADNGSGFAAGGLVGENGAGATIGSSFATGAVTGGAVYTGGLVGYNAGAISNTYAYAGAISGGSDVGGLVGDNAGGGTIATSWSSGAVSGASVLGGAVGQQSGTASNVYWDEGTSGKTLAVGSGSSTGLTGIGGATGKDPHAQATYAGFNFTTTWTINAGTSRAYLKNPAPATPPH
jgi:hypothetical protein